MSGDSELAEIGSMSLRPIEGLRMRGLNVVFCFNLLVVTVNFNLVLRNGVICRSDTGQEKYLDTYLKKAHGQRLLTRRTLLDYKRGVFKTTST